MMLGSPKHSRKGIDDSELAIRKVERNTIEWNTIVMKQDVCIA